MKTIFIDLGKTILNNYGYDFIKAFEKLYEQTEKEISLDEFLTIFSAFKEEKRQQMIEGKEVNLKSFLDKFFEERNISTNCNKEECFFFELTKNEGLMPGAYELLKHCNDKGYQVIAVSNSSISSTVLKKQLEIFGVLKYFEEVISSADILIKKPRSEIFEYAKSFKKYDECYFIGNDYICDVVGPSFVGIKPIWINLKSEEDKLNCAFKIVANCFEIIDILD